MNTNMLIKCGPALVQAVVLDFGQRAEVILPCLKSDRLVRSDMLNAHAENVELGHGGVRAADSRGARTWVHDRR